MAHRIFSTFEEFFEYFELPRHCSLRLTSDEIAYFEFYPYKGDVVVIRGWIKEFNHKEVQVSFKYKEFGLGSTVWSFEDAKKYIRKIDYYNMEQE
jgi:hypothetical protein